MKTLFVVLADILLMIGVNACSSCSSNTAVEAEAPAVENLISHDRQTLFTKYGDNYYWYETLVDFQDWLDEDNDGSIAQVVNIFQVIEDSGPESFDTFVYKYQHVGEDVTEEITQGLWIEDFPLNDEDIRVSFLEAYEKMMAASMPKPHSKHAVLRKQIGPNPCNPQWIFGNLLSQIYVDAITGDVTDVNPAEDMVH